ncbi:MAG: hypothetical protein WAV20_14400, partial [Blastocatellia bacterium]
MRKNILLTLILAVAGLGVVIQSAPPRSALAQGRQANPELVSKRNSIETELQSIAIVERKLMVPMR